MADPFPPSEFDEWAEAYDRDVAAEGFLFDGYERALAAVVALAEPRPDLSVLDLGTGTGNLAAHFAACGCELWCTDFSAGMLAQARLKLPAARFVLHDLRAGWPPEIDRRFDRVVSAYVFHHFPLDEKVRLVKALASERLVPDGRLVIADIAFPDPAAQAAVLRTAGAEWEEEFYWVVSEALPALEQIGLKPAYRQVSACAGVFSIQ